MEEAQDFARQLEMIEFCCFGTMSAVFGQDRSGCFGEFYGNDGTLLDLSFAHCCALQDQL